MNSESAHVGLGKTTARNYSNEGLTEAHVPRHKRNV